MAFCNRCGVRIEDGKNLCDDCAANGDGTQKASDSGSGGSPRVLAGVMGILFGGLGIHKFILGYVTEGVIQLLLTLITCGAAGIIGFIEGIIYLAMDDRKFVETYIRNHRGWF